MKWIKNLIAIPLILIILVLAIILMPVSYLLFKINDNLGKKVTGVIIYLARMIKKFRL